MPCVWRYMPILKWKRGEQNALRYVRENQWDGITPLLELQPIDAAPDAASLKIALPGYIDKLVSQIQISIPEEGSIAIDTGLVSTGYVRQANLLFVICQSLQKKVTQQIIPVIRFGWIDALPGLPSALLDSLKNYPDLVLRIRTDSVVESQIAQAVATLAKQVKRRQIHLLLDQYSLVGKEPAPCVAAATPYLNAASQTSCASITLGGGSFPINLTGKKTGVTDIPRVEWKIWENLTAKNDQPGLRYADYAVTNPIPQEEDIDPTKLNPSIAIRYASEGFWRLYKGRGFKSGAKGELRALCKLLVTDSIYGGQTYCYGDAQYMKYSTGSDKNGVPWTWRRDATNRHIVQTINSL
jgi:hypothetical protein